MASVLTFESRLTSIRDDIANKTKPDAAGYYKVLLGALNIYNSEGKFYEATEAVLNLFNASSSLMTRLKDGALKAEVMHPQATPGMSKRDYIKRIVQIDESKVCGHFNKIEVDTKPTYIKSQKEPVYLVYGWVKPQGVFGNALKSDLDNPESNTAFSIRSLTKERDMAGIRVKTLLHIVTWDWVNIPGIEVAKKSFTASLEDAIIPIDENEISEMITMLEEQEAVSTESEKLALHEIKLAMSTCSTDTGCNIYDSW